MIIICVIFHLPVPYTNYPSTMDWNELSKEEAEIEYLIS